jgi:HDOD domain
METPMIDWATVRAEGLSDFSLSVMPPTLSLPALPHAVTTFLQRSADESVPLEDLARIVETDAGLTVELLKRVNSASSGVSVRVKSVSQALALLGRRPTRLFLTTVGTEAAIRARKSKLINQNSFWNVCLQRALFAREVARLLSTDVDAAFAGGLLQDFLLPLLTNELFDAYLEFVGQSNTAPEALAQFEQSRFDWDHGMAGACLANSSAAFCTITPGCGSYRILSWVARRWRPSPWPPWFPIRSTLITAWSNWSNSKRSGLSSILRAWPRRSIANRPRRPLVCATISRFRDGSSR